MSDMTFEGGSPVLPQRLLDIIERCREVLSIYRSLHNKVLI
jgi:hypothetical protein